MSKARGQTIQQRLGFQDGDLKTPKHDEIMVWLDANLLSLLGHLDNWLTQWSSEDIQKATARAEQAAEKLMEYRKAQADQAQGGLADYQERRSVSPNLYSQFDIERKQQEVESCQEELRKVQDWSGLGPVPAFPPPKIVVRRWEQPIISKGYKSKYVVGFVDLFVKIDIAVGLYSHWTKMPYSETPEGLPYWSKVDDRLTYCFEIKSSIPSLGEVIRQIRMYQEYQNGKYIIVCPDDRFSDSLRAQGVGFLKYDPTREGE